MPTSTDAVTDRAPRAKRFAQARGLMGYMIITAQRTPTQSTAQAIEGLYRARYPQFVRFAVATLGDVESGRDAVHDAFVRALRSADTYRGEAQLESWIWTILVNVCRDARERPRVPLDGDSVGAVAGESEVHACTRAALSACRT